MTPQPEPPAGYKIWRPKDALECLPMDALVWSEINNKWRDAASRGNLPWSNLAYATRTAPAKTPEHAQTETPETDAQGDWNLSMHNSGLVPADFARSLERRLSAQSAELERLKADLGAYSGPAVNPPCPVCPSSSLDQIIFSPVYGGNLHFYCKSCEQRFAGGFTYGPSELETLSAQLDEAREDAKRLREALKEVKDRPYPEGY